MVDIDEIDRILIERAALEGRPSPAAEPGPLLKGLIARIEAELGARVLCRSHGFLYASSVRGSANYDAGYITAYCHPAYPEEKSIQALLHEAGHWRLHQHGELFDRATLDGYFACEGAADDEALRLAGAWGYGHIFTPGHLQEREKRRELQERTAYYVGQVAGSEYAPVVTGVMAHLGGPIDDPNIGAELRAWQKDTWLPLEELAKLALEYPALLVGFDRSVLRSGWSLANSGKSAQPLRIEARSVARERLAGRTRRMASQWRYHPDDSAWRQPQLVQTGDDEPPTIVLWYDCERGDGSIGPYLDAVQSLVINQLPHESMRLTWWVTRTPQMSLYEAQIGWPGEIEAHHWRVLCNFNGGHDLWKEEAALRYYINSFRWVADITHHSPAETMNHLGWLMSQVRGPAPRELLGDLSGRNDS